MKSQSLDVFIREFYQTFEIELTPILWSIPENEREGNTF